MQGQSFFEPAKLLLVATASDADGTVTEVEFFEGSSSLGVGVLNAGQYELVWNNLAAGTYSISVVAKDNDNAATSTVGVTISVGAQAPVAAFNATPLSGAGSVSVTFTDHSRGTPTGWSWDFGDGNRSTVQHPIHTYSSAGDHTVSLMVSNSAGTDQLTHVDYIHVEPPSGMSTFTSVADALVRSGNPTRNYGQEDYLRLRDDSGSNKYNSYLKFDLRACLKNRNYIAKSIGINWDEK